MNTASVFWLTGLSGSGKTTISNALKEQLDEWHISTIIIDGDVLRNGLCKDLGFDDNSRKENIRRAAELAKIIVNSGINVIVALISPFNNDRLKAREIIGNNFYEIYIDCPIEVCENRDPKGLYKKVRSGIITEFTGISSPYEIPTNPDLILNTDQQDIDECISKIWGLVI